MQRFVAAIRSHAFPAVWLGVILGTTLTPLQGRETTRPVLCLLCGAGALADGVLNAALFFPLGAALGLAGWRPFRAVGLGTLLSIVLETVQFSIPGRDPSLADVLFNALGAALGIVLVRTADVWWRPRPRVADGLTLAGALGATSVLALSGLLLGPSFPEDVYYGGWTPRFAHLQWYGGRVLDASLDEVQISPGVIATSPQVRERLRSGATLLVRAQAGPPPPGLAPLFTINDAHQREILFLGVDGDDLVYRYRTRALDWGFVGPELRAVGALRGITWRDPLSVIVRRTRAAWCVDVNVMEHCGLGHTLGSGWALVLGRQGVPVGLQSAPRIAWLATLFFPIGLWARFGLAFALAGGMSLAGLLILPPSFDLLPTPGMELLGALAGLLVGWAISPQRHPQRHRASG